MSVLPTPRAVWHLDTRHVGREVRTYASLDSTNALALQLEAAEGLALIADHQTRGRGQHGRVWVSRPGSSLLLSVVVEPPRELLRPVILTAWAAVAVGEAIFALAGVQARIKWPNDLLIRGQKVCGILIEQASTADRTVTVAGIGLNLTQTADEFAAGGLPTATSLQLVSGKPVAARHAAEVLLRALDSEYARLLAGERVAVEADWKWRVGLLGRPVRVEHVGGAGTEGRLREMSFDGLEVEDATGAMRVIPPEAVTHLWPLDRV